MVKGAKRRTRDRPLPDPGEPVTLPSDLVELKPDHDAPLRQELDGDAPVHVPHEQGWVEIGVVQVGRRPMLAPAVKQVDHRNQIAARCCQVIAVTGVLDQSPRLQRPEPASEKGA
jgi:hypothetical protein